MSREIVLEPNEKQKEFFLSTAKYTAYGGARGGGKSWAMRTKLVLLAIEYDGIQILLLRRTLGELRENHLFPLLELLSGIASYNSSCKEFLFPNGSRIKLGYCDSENDVLQFQGQAYEVIGLEEATHFTQRQFLTLTESNRASGRMKGPFAVRMYFTCNPGGVGHDWVKRLFIDRDFRGNEKAENYLFIKSLVFDNKFLMERDPGYVETLENLPEVRKKAMLYGDWDSFEGAFFPEFTYARHTTSDFVLPDGGLLFRSLDYGLDMTCCLWISCDRKGNLTVYRELHESGLILSDAAKKIINMTPKNENIRYTVASPDLWNRRQDSGKSGVETMAQVGLKKLIKAANSRIPGWRTLREHLKDSDDTPSLLIHRSCENLIHCLPLLRFDTAVREDASSSPHDITHAPEALRYAVMSRQPSSGAKRTPPSSSVYSFDVSCQEKEKNKNYESFIDY